MSKKDDTTSETETEVNNADNQQSTANRLEKLATWAIIIGGVADTIEVIDVLPNWAVSFVLFYMLYRETKNGNFL